MSELTELRRLIVSEDPSEQELKLAFIADHPGFTIVVGNPLYRREGRKHVPTKWVVAEASRTRPDGTFDLHEVVGNSLASAFLLLDDAIRQGQTKEVQ